MDKVKINNQVVLMRKFAKQGKVHAINKLVKEAKLLQNRKGNDVQVQKARRKAERYLEEVKILKAMKPDYVSKMALSKVKNWKEILEQKDFTLEERCLAILANYPAVQKEVENFHSANPILATKIPDFVKEWEEKSKLPKELRKKKNILDSSNFTDVNKGDLNFKSKAENVQKKMKFNSFKADTKIKSDQVNINSVKDDSSVKKTLIKSKVRKGSEKKNIKQKLGLLKDKQKISIRRQTDIFNKSEMSKESLNDNNVDNVSTVELDGETEVGKDTSKKDVHEVGESTSLVNYDPDIDEHALVKDDYEVGDNISYQDDSEVEDNMSNLNDCEIDENMSERDDDNEVDENTSVKNYSEVEENTSIKNDSVVNENASEIEDVMEVNNIASGKDGLEVDREDENLFSNLNAQNKKNFIKHTSSNKCDPNSVKKVKLSKETKINVELSNKTPAESIIKSSTKNHSKAITMLNLNDLEGLDEIPIEKTSGDEFDDDEKEQNSEYISDPFFLRSGETANFDDKQFSNPKRDSFSPKHDSSNFQQKFDGNEMRFKNNFKRNFDANSCFNKETGFREANFSRNRNPNFKNYFQRRDSDHGKNFSRERDFFKHTFQQKNQKKIQHIGRKEFCSEGSFNKEEQNRFGRKTDKQSFMESSKKQFKDDGATAAFNRAKFQNKKGSNTCDTSLHPSWEAKKKQKELAQAPFQGKRMVFSN